MDDELLISLVRSHPAFYNVRDPGYSDYVYKQRAWKLIASELNVDVSVCKARWNNIRDNYRKSLKKNATRSAQAKKTKLYKYADQLGFIFDFFEERMDKSTGSSEVFTEEYEGNAEELVTEEEEEEEEIEIKPEIGVSMADFGDSFQFEPTPVAVPEVKLGKRTKLTRDSYSKAPTTERPAAEYRFEELDTGTQSPHPVDAFLAGIAPTLKTFSPYFLNLAKSEIFAAVQKYEMRMLEQQLEYGKPTSTFGDVTIMAPSTSRSDSTSSPTDTGTYED